MAWALVQAISAAPTNAATGTIVFGSNVTAGNLILAFTGDGNTTDTLTCAQSAGTAVISAMTSFATATDATSASQIAAFWGTVTTGGSLTLTISGGTNGGIQQREGAEYSGGSATPFERGAGANGVAGSATANADTSPSQTSTNNGDLYVGWIWDDQSGGANTYSAGTSPNSFTSDDTTNNMCLEHFVQASNGALQPTFTGSGTDRYMSVTGVFIVAASATAPGHSGQLLTELPPKARQPLVDLRTWLWSTVTKFPSGKPFNQRDWPVPRGYDKAFANRTWLGENLLPLTSVPKPFALYDWPVPKGPEWNRQLKTWLWKTVDLFPSGQPPFTYDWPNPKGPIYPVSLRSWVNAQVIYYTIIPPGGGAVYRPYWPMVVLRQRISRYR